MLPSYITNIITSIKQSHTIPAILSTLTGIRPPRIGSAICAPTFIRDDHNPSFGVYEHLAIDFSTGRSYDAISLVMLALNMSFLEAVEYLHGSPLNYNKREREVLTSAQASSRTYIDSKVHYWHDALLSDSAMLDYLHSRHITNLTIHRFRLGYSSKRGRIMFPFSYNGNWVNFIGRDMLNRYTKPRKLPNGDDNPAFSPKYQKAKLDGPGHESFRTVPWGLQTLKPGKKHFEEYEGADGQKYQSDTEDPRDGILCVTEGMLDALSLAQDGWQVLATGGGDMPEAFMSEFLDYARSYREVFVCFDNDNPGAGFQRKMCRILFNAHVMFKCGHIPHEVNGQPVKDISDYYCAGGDLAELVADATPGLVEMAKNAKGLDELASLFKQAALWVPEYKMFEMKEACYFIEDDKVKEETGFRYAKYSKKMINFLFSQAMKPIPEDSVAHMVESKHTLMFDPAGTFYEYTRGIWEQISDYEVRGYVAEALGQKGTSGRMKNVVSFIKDIHSVTDREMVKLLNRKPVFVFMNGTLHLDEPDKTTAFTPHAETDLSTQCVPYSYNAAAKAVKWLRFIHDICNGDPAKMRLMQQMAGYVLCPDNRLQKFFFLLGDGSNGKSVFMNLLEAVYGHDNCSSVQPSRLGTQFDPIALKDSMLNLCYEAKVALNGSEEALKAVASGDTIMAAHKGVDAVKFATRAKFFIAANKIFASDDVSYGFLRRIIFMKFDRQFTGAEANKNLTRELLEELPGIFNWCYEGYLDLMQSGEFEELADQASVVDELMTQMSPTGLFVKEVLPAQSGRVLDDKQIYTLYKLWCDDGGFKRLNRLEFMKDVMLLIRQSKLKVKVIHNDEGKRLFVFPGTEEGTDMASERAEDGGPAKAGVVIALSDGMASGSAGQAQSTAEAPQAVPDDAESAGVREAEAQAPADDGDPAGPEAEDVPGHVDDVRGDDAGGDGDSGGEVPIRRAQEAPMSEAELTSRNTYTFDSPSELFRNFVLGTIPGGYGALTLGDWGALYEYCYKAHPECRKVNAIDMTDWMPYINALKYRLNDER